MAYVSIKVETRGRVGLITLDRPEALNALNSEMMGELLDVVEGFDRDAKIGAMVITGSEKAFAAGADIKEMQNLDFVDAYLGDFIGQWNRISQVRKPLLFPDMRLAVAANLPWPVISSLLLTMQNSVSRKLRWAFCRVSAAASV